MAEAVRDVTETRREADPGPPGPGRAEGTGRPVVMLAMATLGFAVNFWAWALIWRYRYDKFGWTTPLATLFQLHALSAMALFCIWPFTRLVHMLTAPLGYLTRPYIVYRSRDEQLGMHRPRRCWERVP